MIEVEDLYKVYPGSPPVVAAEGVSFVARPGQVFGLLGPNGAGKTTTLRVIATMLRPTSGAVRVAGRSVAEDAQGVRARLGFVSSSTGLYERLTARETLRTFGRLNGLVDEPLEARIDELLDLFDMRAFADRRCGLLSTGQKQKVSISRALIHDPPVLVFDEPTSGLDVLVARTVVEQIGALTAARRTILLSTHILREAERLCDSLAIIHRGRVRAAGTIPELLARTGRDDLEQAFFAIIDETEAEAARG